MRFNPAFNNALLYFDGLLGNLYHIAYSFAMVIAVLGLVWECVQLSFGTLETRKFVAGNVVKWFLFMLVMNIYPAVTTGVRSVALQIARNYGESTGEGATQFITDAMKSQLQKLNFDEGFVEYLKNPQAYRNNHPDDPNLAQYNEMSEMKTEGHKFIGGSYASKKLKEADEKNANRDLLNSMRKSQIIEKDRDNLARYWKLTMGKSTLPSESDLENVQLNLEMDVMDYLGNVQTYQAVGREDNHYAYTYSAVKKWEGILSLDAIWNVAMLMFNTIYDRVTSMEYYSQTSSGQQFLGTYGEDADSSVVTNGMQTAQQVGVVGAGKGLLFPSDLPLMGLIRVGLCLVACIMAGVCIICCIVQYAMCMIEYVIVTGFSIILIPCMLMDGLKDMAQRVISTFFQQAVKMCMIVIMIYYVFHNLGITGSIVIADTSEFGLELFFYILFSSILCLALSSNAPKIASVICTGSPQMSMGELVQAAGAIAGGTALSARVGSSAVKTGIRGAGNAVSGVHRAHEAGKSSLVAARQFNQENPDKPKMNTMAAYFRGAGASAAKQAGTAVSDSVKRSLQKGGGAFKEGEWLQDSKSKARANGNSPSNFSGVNGKHLTEDARQSRDEYLKGTRKSGGDDLSGNARA